MPRSRLRLVGLALALFLIAPAAVASASEQVLPLLWAGQVQDEAGLWPSGVEVVAFARPPVEDLEVGVGLAEVARTTTDGDGRFALRTAPSAAMTGNADPAGWTTVMVAAFGGYNAGRRLGGVATRQGVRRRRWALGHESRRTIQAHRSHDERRRGRVSGLQGAPLGDGPRGWGSGSLRRATVQAAERGAGLLPLELQRGRPDERAGG